MSTLYFASFGSSLESTELRFGTTALDKNDYLVYDKSTGNLYYDSDGSGIVAKQLVTTVTAGTVLTLSDFVLW